MALLDTIGGKIPGELIRSDDWNTLVQAVDDLTASVETRFNAVEAQIASLAERVDTLQQTVEDRVLPLLAQYYRVSLETSSTNYALGEQAVITARVTDLFGNPLNLTDATRPWVDFVSSWGQFKAASGFSSRDGAGEHAISVRTNLNGVAQVILRSEHVTEADDGPQNAMVALMQEPMPQQNNVTVNQFLMQATNPAAAQPAYEVIASRYNQVGAVQQYLDGYYQYWQVPPIQTFPGSWTYYRSTVMAFVKDDSDPLTPDPGRGFSSIQVSFRDWVNPWVFDYWQVEDDDDLVVQWRDDFINNFDDEISIMTERFKDVVQGNIRADGIIGRIQDQIILEKALGQVPFTDPVQEQIGGAIQYGIGVQRNIEQAGRGGLTQDAGAFGAFADIAQYSGSGATQAAEQLGVLQEEIAQASSQLQNLQSTVSAHGGNIETLLSDSGPLNQIRGQISTVEGQVQQFMNFNPSEVIDKTQQVDLLNIQMEEVLRMVQLRG